MSDKKLLQVGDIIYSRGNYGFTGKYVIERTTKTQAISGEAKFKIETYGSGKNIRASKIGQSFSYNSSSYYLETPELKHSYWREKAIIKLKGFDYSILTDEAVIDLLIIINPKTETA